MLLATLEVKRLHVGCYSFIMLKLTGHIVVAYMVCLMK